MMKPLISVIIPVYNVQEHIVECLESVKNQSFRDFEVIIVNDGTKDNSAVLAEEFVNKYELKNFKIIHKENGGVSSARNTGIAVARGDWLLFIDSDDYIQKDYLLAFASKLQEYPADLYQAGHSKYYQQTGVLTQAVVQESFYGTFAASIDKILFVYNVAKLFSARIIRENNLKFDERIVCGEDRSFNFDYLPYVNKCVFIDDTSYVYRRSNNSVTATSIRPEKKRYMYYHAKAFWKSFADEGFIIEKYKENYHLAHNILDCFLTEVINMVLLRDEKNYREIATDDFAKSILNNYLFTKSPIKERALVFLFRHRMLWCAKAVIRLYYSDFLYGVTRRFFGKTIEK